MKESSSFRVCVQCGRRVWSDNDNVLCWLCRLGNGLREAQNAKKAAVVARIAGFPLMIELVPETSWFCNLRAKVKPDVWDVIRREAYRKAGYKCSICDHRGRLYCHEVWVYDDERHIQKLDGFVALCEWCHMVKHIGYAEGFYDKYKALAGHFMRVNDCSFEDFLAAKDMAFEVWAERSEFPWEIDLGEYAKMVEG
jgi:hypothetical protein